MDSDFILTVLEDGRNHLRMQECAHCGNEKRCGHLVVVQKLEHTRQSRLSAEIPCRKRVRQSLSGSQQIRLIIDIEAQAYGHAGMVRPRARSELSSHTGWSHGLPQLLLAQFCSRLGILVPLLSEHVGWNNKHCAERQY